MKLYHGSTMIVRKPSVKRGRVTTDFGQGFYLTTSLEQAQRWALLKQRRENSKRAIVSVFDFDETMLTDIFYNEIENIVNNQPTIWQLLKTKKNQNPKNEEKLAVEVESIPKQENATSKISSSSNNMNFKQNNKGNKKQSKRKHKFPKNK